MAEIITKTGSKKNNDVSGMIGLSGSFAYINKLITRDMNQIKYVPTFSLYTKNDIIQYLTNPYKYEKQLRRAVIYIYGASPHFRRLIQYFVGLSDLAYVVEPYNVDPHRASKRIINNNYRKVLSLLTSMNIKTQLPKILTVCFREDVFYGYFWMGADNVTIQQLPSDYCSISSIENNVLNITFNFAYFDVYQDLLEYYPEEFKRKYNLYKKNRISPWIELDSPYAFCIKANTDILDYAIPPFAGILREIYDLEDYKNMKLTKTALENYAMLAMTLPMNDEGEWLLDYKKAKEFWQNLDSVLPEEVGSVLTPMKIDKISFEKSNTGDTDTIADAEQNLFTAAGVSSLLFNNEKASANALLLAIKNDQAMTYGVVKSIGDVINRLIQAQPYGKNFRVEFLNISAYNSKEAGDAYLKAASYGLPTISAYAASQGIGQAELDSMSFLETEVLGLQNMFKPLISSSQMSSREVDGGEPGAPTKDTGELTDSGEQNREDGDDW